MLVLGKAATAATPLKPLNNATPAFRILAPNYIHSTSHIDSPRVGNAASRWTPQKPRTLPTRRENRQLHPKPPTH